MKYQSLKEFANIFTCTRTVLIFFFIITVFHTEKTIRYMSSDTNSTAVLQDLEKNETNTTNIYLTPFKNCPNTTLEEDFEPYQMNVLDEKQELFMYLMWSLLLIGIAHAYSEWRNEVKNGIKTATLVDFIFNYRLLCVRFLLLNHLKKMMNKTNQILDMKKWKLIIQMKDKYLGA